MPRATPDGMKVCSKCRENKPVGAFHRSSREQDGLQNACKSCRSLTSKAYYTAHSDKAKAVSAAWRAANPDKRRATHVAWYAANREKVCATQKARYAANPDKIKAINAAWNAANPEKVKAARKAWWAANPDKKKAKRAKETARLPDWQVKCLLNLKDAPPELIELKRLQVQIKRELKRQEQSK